MHGKNKITAITKIMAILFLLGGCAMKPDIRRLEEKTDAIRSDQLKMKAAIERLDSLFHSEAQSSRQLRAEMSAAINDLVEQFRITQANLNDLQDKIGRNATRATVIAEPTTPTRPTGSLGDTFSIPPEVDCQMLYDDSFVNIRQGLYEEAIKGFNDFLKYCGKLELASDAHYWLGESYYSVEKYKEAIAEFDAVVKNYPSSRKRPGAMYKMARCHEELGQKKDAKAIFNKIVDEFPNTLEASQAKEKLKELK
jgi:tol-pal system protein YbgF